MVKLGAKMKKFLTPFFKYRYATIAPINRVLPTPVAIEKAMETKSLSKSVQVGK